LKAKAYAEKVGVEFNWFLPTCYKNLDPVGLGFGVKACSACRVNMLIQPDGSVIPCQSWIHESFGSFLDLDWNSIWNSELAKKIRGHGFVSDDCKVCDRFSECGGACPLSKINSGCNGCSGKV
jgi:radical SAM protein with 4Fe4S-binding SPASM domain